MNLYRDLGIATQAVIFALRGLRRDQTLEPLVLLGLTQALLLAALVWFYLPSLAPWFEPLIRAISGEAATHYPEHLWTLPETFRNANLVVLLTVGVLAHAVATARFARSRASWVDALRRMPSLVLVALAGPGCAWGVTTAMNQIPTRISLSSFVVRIGLQGVELGLIVVILSLTAYAVAFVIIEQRNPVRALGASARLAKHFALPTLLLFATPAALLFPPTFFLVEMNVTQSGLTPEMVAAGCCGLVALQWVFSTLLTGAVTGLWLERPGVRR